MSARPAPQQGAALDFETYRTRIEPVFLKQRESGPRCYDCHSAMNTRLRLEPLAEATSSWTEEQSRKNFEAVLQLVVPGEPLKSRLLVHPLAAEAGGDPAHGGGKFWKSQSDPEWRMLAEWVRQAAPAPTSAHTTANSQSGDGLDFESFKASVQPIFLKERPGHARCYGCHNSANRAFHLVALSPSLTDWTEEQSWQNFESAVQLVVPGKPQSSRLLTHPLAPEAGGDAFHSGGRQFASQEDPDWAALADWVRAARGPSSRASASSIAARIYITNSAGNTVDVIDSATNQVVQVIRGIELPHGVTFSPDGKRVYISNESESILDVVDRESAEILKKVALSGHPNNLTITKDGARILVGIREDPGSVDVIDAKSLERTNSIPVDGSVHNIFVTPDGKYAVSGSIENKAATVIDLNTEKAAWEVKFDRGVRPMAFEANSDGSTRRIYVQLSTLNGFAVVDFASHKEVARIKLPEQPGGFGTAEERLGTPSHGIGVTPDGKSLWVNSTVANAVFKYTLPDLQLVGYCPLPTQQPAHHPVIGAVPEWITFTPDSQRVYDSNSGARSVSVIDAKTLKLVDVVNVGEVPKRINTLVVY
ncbi:MAG TPA: cytochrome D1 domain-containing protein [Candidatus Acidoferrum sp.]|nr:cytochrome D1 domain-containing protein [Candidatus Acidoferrum sp.]